MEKQVLSLEVNWESLYTLKVTCSSLILKNKLSLWTSIKALAVAKKVYVKLEVLVGPLPYLKQQNQQER